MRPEAEPELKDEEEPVSFKIELSILAVYFLGAFITFGYTAERRYADWDQKLGEPALAVAGATGVWPVYWLARASIGSTRWFYGDDEPTENGSVLTASQVEDLRDEIRQLRAEINGNPEN